MSIVLKDYGMIPTASVSGTSVSSLTLTIPAFTIEFDSELLLYIFTIAVKYSPSSSTTLLIRVRKASGNSVVFLASHPFINTSDDKTNLFTESFSIVDFPISGAQFILETFNTSGSAVSVASMSFSVIVQVIQPWRRQI
jgi:hypothetical protein